jgi:hypothetical protein
MRGAGPAPGVLLPGGQGRDRKIPTRREVEDRYDKWASAVIAICVLLVMK